VLNLRFRPRMMSPHSCPSRTNLCDTGQAKIAFAEESESSVKKLVTFVLFAATAGASRHRLFDQPAPILHSNVQCGFSEVYQRDGWRIAGLSGATDGGPRAALTLHTEGKEDESKQGIFVTSLNAGKLDLRLTVLQCSQDFPARLVIRVVSVRVLEMWRFDFDGKIFAYGARYEPQTVPRRGVPHSTLEYVQVVFYDVDGSGRFTVMQYQNSRLFQSLEVPEWAKGTNPR